MSDFPPTSVTLLQHPPGGWSMFTAHASAELFLVFAYDVGMLWPAHPPLLSFRGRCAGWRRAFSLTSATLGRPADAPAECADAQGRVGGVSVWDGRVATGLAVVAEADEAASMVGVVHAWPLALRERVILRLEDVIPGGTQPGTGPRLAELPVQVGPGWPMWAWTHVLDEGAFNRLPADVDARTRARIVAHATPERLEPSFPRGRHYVAAIRHALATLGATDPDVEALALELEGLSAPPR